MTKQSYMSIDILIITIMIIATNIIDIIRLININFYHIYSYDHIS